MKKMIAMCSICFVLGGGAMFGAAYYQLRDKLVLDQDGFDQLSRYFFIAGAQAASRSCSRTQA